MNLSEYSYKIYGKRPNNYVSIIDNQPWFISALFFAAGSKHFENDLSKFIAGTITSHADMYQTKLFNGSKRFAPNIKDTFKPNRTINRDNLSSFFDDCIGDSSFKIVINNFVGNTNIPFNRKAFTEALCSQFQLIVKDEQDNVDDVVESEYLRFTQIYRVEKFFSQEEHDNLMSDLENMLGVIPVLKKLLILLNKYDLSDKVLPVFVIARLDESAASINSMGLNNQELSTAKKEYLKNQAAYSKYLLKNTKIVPNTNFRQIHRFPLVGEANIRDSEYMQNEVDKLRKSLISSIEKIIEVEKKLRDTI